MTSTGCKRGTSYRGFVFHCVHDLPDAIARSGSVSDRTDTDVPQMRQHGLGGTARGDTRFGNRLNPHGSAPVAQGAGGQCRRGRLAGQSCRIVGHRRRSVAVRTHERFAGRRTTRRGDGPHCAGFGNGTDPRRESADRRLEIGGFGNVASLATDRLRSRGGSWIGDRCVQLAKPRRCSPACIRPASSSARRVARRQRGSREADGSPRGTTGA